MLRGEVAGELLGEVLDHVVAFGLAVYEDLRPGLLLEGDHLADLGPDALLVRRVADPAGPQIGPCGAEFRRLRERADGGGRQQGQAEVRALGCRPFGVRLRAGRRGAVPGQWWDGCRLRSTRSASATLTIAAHVSAATFNAALPVLSQAASSPSGRATGSQIPPIAEITA